MNATIDFEAIAERADLPELMARRGVEVRHGKALCPFHDNTNTPALTVFRAGGRWRFMCKSCGVKGDAIGFIAAFERIPPLEAAMQLGGIVREDLQRKASRSPKASIPTPRATPESPEASGGQDGAYKRSRADPEPWEDPGWQEAADEIIGRASDRLWSPDGAEALEWLRARGLMDHTIRKFRLGFVAEMEQSRTIVSLEKGEGQPRITARRGITIPWCHPEAWYHASEPTLGPRWVGCNVRTLASPDPFAPLPDGQEKCLALKGSRRGYPYPFADLVSGLPVVLAEGEWDALIAWQQFGWVVNVVSVGGARQDPKPSALATMNDCPNWMLALHNDEAGNAGAKRWSIRGKGKAVRLMLPPEVDLNDMHLRGDDLLSWLRSEFDSLGWEWPILARSF